MNRDYFSFHGSGGALLMIYLKNILFSIFTLGLYFPWALVNVNKYLYENVEFKQRHFAYTGSGKEIFKGFLKAVLIIIAIGLIIYLVQSLGIPSLTSIVILLLYIGYIVAIPYIVHHALKYDYANTTYNGIRMGYRGDLEEFIKLFLKGIFLTLITLGIYGSWFSVEMRKYVAKHTRLGNIELSFEGSGGENFMINLKGIIFSILTLGIYMFWWLKNAFNFWITHTKVHYNGQTYDLNSDLTGGKIFVLFFTNTLLIIFTLGIGAAWADVRTYKFICENCSLDNDIDPDAIEQTEPSYHDAIGVGAMEGIGEG